MKYIESKLQFESPKVNGDKYKAYIDDTYIDDFGKVFISRRRPEFEDALTFEKLLERVKESEGQLSSICKNYQGRIY